MTLAPPPENDRIVIQWTRRPEDAATLAARLTRMIEDFGRCDRRLDRWRESALTQREASVPFSTSPPQVGAMTRRLAAARCLGAKGQPLTPPLFQLNLQNWAFGRPLELSASIGEFARPDTALPNRIDLVVPRTADTTPLLKPALLALIDAWAPIAGRIDPPGLSKRRNGRQRPRVEAGWVTYLAAPLARLVSPPADATREPVADGGLLLSVGDQPFDASDGAALAVWRSIQDSLAVMETTWPYADAAASPNPESDR